jgi:Fic family protein
MPVLYLSSFIIKNKALYYQLLRQVTENDNWNDWVLYILNGLVETSQTTIEKIKKMLQLKDETEIKMKEVLGASYNHDLLQLMFTLPYLKIELLEKGNLAHRQTASTWLKKLSEAGILSPQKIGRTNYFVNENLIKIFSE